LKFFPDTTKGPIKRINYDSKPKKHELNVEKNKRDKAYHDSVKRM